MPEALFIRGPQDGPTYHPTQDRGPVKAHFFMGSAQDIEASREAGRPILRDVEMVELSVAGDIRSRPVKKVNDQIRRDFKEEYDAWKKGEDAPLSGKALVEWGFLKPAACETLKHFGILTLQDLAQCTDVMLQNIGPGYREAREQAKALYEVFKHTEVVKTVVAEAPETKMLTDQVAALSKQVELLMSMVPKPTLAGDTPKPADVELENKNSSLPVTAGGPAAPESKKIVGAGVVAAKVV